MRLLPRSRQVSPTSPTSASSRPSASTSRSPGAGRRTTRVRVPSSRGEERRCPARPPARPWSGGAARGAGGRRRAWCGCCQPGRFGDRGLSVRHAGRTRPSPVGGQPGVRLRGVRRRARPCPGGLRGAPHRPGGRGAPAGPERVGPGPGPVGERRPRRGPRRPPPPRRRGRGRAWSVAPAVVGPRPEATRGSRPAPTRTRKPSSRRCGDAGCGCRCSTRATLALRYVEERSWPEVAWTTGLSERATRRRAEQGLAALAPDLGRRRRSRWSRRRVDSRRCGRRCARGRRPSRHDSGGAVVARGPGEPAAGATGRLRGGAAALLAAAVGVPLAVSRSGPAPPDWLDLDPSPDDGTTLETVLPEGFRTEAWRGVEVGVPEDWGHGSAGLLVPRADGLPTPRVDRPGTFEPSWLRPRAVPRGAVPARGRAGARGARRAWSPRSGSSDGDVVLVATPDAALTAAGAGDSARRRADRLERLRGPARDPAGRARTSHPSSRPPRRCRSAATRSASPGRTWCSPSASASSTPMDARRGGRRGAHRGRPPGMPRRPG